MAVVEKHDSFVIEQQSGEVFLVVEQDAALVEAIEQQVVETAELSLEILQESSDGINIESGPEESVVAVDQPEQVILESACFQGPPGPRGLQGPAGTFGLPVIGVYIAPGATEEVDAAPIDALIGMDWSIVAKTTADGLPPFLRRGVRVYATWDGNGDTYRTVYARNGGGFVTFSLVVTLIAGSLVMRVTNNHTEDILVSGTRLEIAELAP